MKSIVLYILFLLTSAEGYGQVFGGHPPSQKWMQINGEHLTRRAIPHWQRSKPHCNPASMIFSKKF
ncbi:MAG: hypothetical protein EOP48_28525 [Sphingobacteriales bacterium]|nr:MAG: hypothetical protein EOP48_28525 [Sphingobacteriales bacterium]